MSGQIINCKKCNKVFQQVRLPYCPDCAKAEEDKFSVMYRTLQKSAATGGILLDDLSAQMEIAPEDIERYFVEGRLGTAAAFLMIECQACGERCGVNQRSGRFCRPCGESTANEAQVDIYSVRELNQRDASEQMRQQQEALLRQNQARRAVNYRFGNSVKPR